MIGTVRDPVACSSLVVIAIVVTVIRTTAGAAVLLPPREGAQPAIEWAAASTEERREDAAAAVRVEKATGSGVAARLETDASAWPRAFAKLLLDGAERPAPTAFARRRQQQEQLLWQRTLDEVDRKPEADVRQIAEVYSADVLRDGADAPLPGVGDDAVVITRSKQRRTRSRRKRNFAKISNRRRPTKKTGQSA